MRFFVAQMTDLPAAPPPDPRTTYGAMANPDLVARVPPRARSVVDVGCGAGGFGRALRTKGFAGRLTGIEPDPVLAAQAAAHYDRVHRIDIDVQGVPMSPGSVDVLVYGDVLEHLRDPWGVLKRDAGLLAPGGTLLVCIPNLEHWSFAARLLAGRWRYEETGLFDRTHLRWFTRGGMQDAILAAGLRPVETVPRIFDREKAEDFAAKMRPGLVALGVDPEAWLRRSLPLQYVWRAVKPDIPGGP
jgi:SAM-dependent methyltransferase